MEKRDEDKETIVKRAALAKKELQFSKYYDYVITNKTVTTAVTQAADIILAHQ
jgi:guanylate kinase